MEDPVTAEDKFNYERSAIEDWFKKGFTVSPQSKEAMGEKLEPNENLKKTIEEFKKFVLGTTQELSLTWKHHGMCSGQVRKVVLSRSDVREEPVQMCEALSKFFKEVDPIEDLLHRMLHGLKPPKIIVVGDASRFFWNTFFNI